MLIFNAIAVFKTAGWNEAYFLWDKAKDTLFLLAFFKMQPKLCTIVAPILGYSIIRLCFQIKGIFIPTDQNDIYVVVLLYLIALVITLYLTIKQLTEEWKHL